MTAVCWLKQKQLIIRLRPFNVLIAYLRRLFLTLTRVDM